MCLPASPIPMRLGHRSCTLIPFPTLALPSLRNCSVVKLLDGAP